MRSSPMQILRRRPECTRTISNDVNTVSASMASVWLGVTHHDHRALALCGQADVRSSKAPAAKIAP